MNHSYKPSLRRLVACGLLPALLSWAHAQASRPTPPASSVNKNSFDLTQSTLPISDIISGGPGRDGIPALNNPRFVKADSVDYLQSGDLVVGLILGERARAYPLRILAWHEIVNDQFGSRFVAVTYCPLCGTAMVFDRQVNDRVLDFGVSGLLYHNNVLMYDRQTESLWSQLALRAVSGPLATNQLEWIPSIRMTWQAWKLKHPQSEVLSIRTGHARDYSKEAYESYEEGGQPLFPMPAIRNDLPSMAWVLGIVQEGQAAAYPLEALPLARQVVDQLGSRRLSLSYYAPSRQPLVVDAETGQPVPAVAAYWFAWQAFYPRTRVWR